MLTTFLFPLELSSLHEVDGVKDISSRYPNSKVAAGSGPIKWLDGDGHSGMVAQHIEPIACEGVEVWTGIDILAIDQNA